MIHLTIQQLSSILDGEMSEPNGEFYRDHFAACGSCASKLDQLQKQDTALAHVLSIEPGESHFEPFSLELEARIRSEAAKGLAERAATTGATASRPATPAPHGGESSAALLAEFARELPLRRAPSRGRPHPPLKALLPVIRTLIIVAIAGIVGMFIFGSGRSGSRASKAPGEKFIAGMGSPAPGLSRDIPSLSGMGPDARTTQPLENAWRSDSTDDIESAGEESYDAEAQSSTTSYDEAAEQLELSLPRLQGDEYHAARLRLADARYHAWQLEPSKERAMKASGAIRAYLVASSPGPEREAASRWLSKVVEAGY